MTLIAAAACGFEPYMLALVRLGSTAVGRVTSWSRVGNPARRNLELEDTMSERICRLCHKSESEHHAFSQANPPEGAPDCGCFGDGRWYVTNGVVCTRTEKDNWNFCRKCRHDWGCHKGIRDERTNES